METSLVVDGIFPRLELEEGPFFYFVEVLALDFLALDCFPLGPRKEA